MMDKCFKCGKAITGSYLYCTFEYSDRRHLTYPAFYLCYFCGKNLVND